MNSNELPRLALIVVAALAFMYVIKSYNSSGNNNNGSLAVENNFPVNNMNNIQNNEVMVEEEPNVEGFYADGEQTENAPARGMNMEAETVTEDESDEEPNPAENGVDENATFKTIPDAPANNAANNAAANNATNNAAANNGNRLPSECYPKDVLTPKDLLPQDANSTWAQTVPAGQGSLGDQNFLNAGFHVGINTVGQSLRNANLQLRSEPPNPQLKVSPWLQTTIGPDVNRRALEIGEV